MKDVHKRFHDDGADLFVPYTSKRPRLYWRSRGDLEPFFAAAATAFADNLDWWEARWHQQAFLRPLLDDRQPLGDLGLLLLGMGLVAKEAGESGLAVDVAIRAVDDGRLGADNLGHVLGLLFKGGLVVTGRLAKTLGEVARVSGVHMLVVKQAVERCLRGEKGDFPKDFGKLLQALLEWNTALALPVDDDALSTLKTFKGSSVAAKAAKALLKLPAADAAVVERLSTEVFNLRAEAARAWMS